MIINKESIKDSAKIEEVIGSLIELKKKGSNHMGCCPFHGEKTPSFSVSPAKQIYKCFGCDEGGDVFQFVMKKLNLDFTEAIEFVANFYSIPIEYKNESPEEIQHRKEVKDQTVLLTESLERGLTIYRKMVWSKPIMTTNQFVSVAKRAYRKETLQDFEVCIVDDWNTLTNQIKKNPIDFKNLSELGVIKKKKESDGHYDLFHHRILFPIRNHKSSLIGLAGRVVDNSKPKYINSPENLLYEKGAELYGLHLTKKHITKRKFAYLVEGYTDVLSLYEFGIQNVVGKCGSALTLRQARLLSRFTNDVTMFYDGDNAGRNSAEKDIETLLEAGITKVNILHVPDGSDPDDLINQLGKEKFTDDSDSDTKYELIRTFGKEAFKEYSDSKTEDAIKWRVRKAHPNKSDEHEKYVASDLAISYLMHFDNEFLVQSYIEALSKPEILKTKISNLQKIYDKRLAKDDDIKDERNLSKQQREDIYRYGIYEHKKSYYYETTKGTGFQITNFVIEPIMLIRYADNAKRVLKITNELNHSFLTAINSKDFIKINSFWEIITGRGNFSYSPHAKSEHHTRIQQKIIAEMKGCYPIEILGWQPEGFLAWSNGMTDEKGVFQEVDQNGIVEFKNEKYYLPHNSKIDGDIRTEDGQTELDFHKFYTFKEYTKRTSWENLTERFEDVFYKGEAKLVISWYLAALYKSVIYKIVGGFPHVNLFGEPGAGKSALGKLMVSMFGGLYSDDAQMNTLNLLNTTVPAFYGKLMQYKDGIVWCDELNDDVSVELTEAVKGAYDGTGKNKRKDAKDYNTAQTKVNSSLILSGQRRPTRDIAMLERCIAIVIDYKKEEADQVDKFMKFIEEVQSGKFTYFTAEFQQHRKYIKENFLRAFMNCKNRLKEELKEYDVKDRMISNFSIPITVMGLLSEKIKFGFKHSDLRQYAIDILINNIQSIENEGDAGKFWQIFEHLISDNKIKDDKDYKISKTLKVTVEVKGARKGDKKQTQKINFEEVTELLYIRINTIYGYYADAIRRMEGVKAMSQNDLIEYLKSKSYFVGKSRGTKFSNNSKSYPALVFDLQHIDMSLNNSNVIDDEDENLLEPEAKPDLPF